MGRHHSADRRKALRPARPEMGISKGSGHLLDHRHRHGPLAPAVPLQGGGQIGVEPPANPLHGCWQRKSLGDRQAPGAAGMGGINDHRSASDHGLLDALVQALLDIHPGALHCCITKHFSADHVGGKHQRWGLTGASEQGRQCLCQRGFAAGGLADQQVAAQGHHRGRGNRGFHYFARKTLLRGFCGLTLHSATSRQPLALGRHQRVRHGKVERWGSAVSSTSRSSSAWAASMRSKGSRCGCL